MVAWGRCDAAVPKIFGSPLDAFRAVTKPGVGETNCARRRTSSEPQRDLSDVYRVPSTDPARRFACPDDT